MQNPWKTLSKSDKYDNPWIHVAEHQVINPSGNRGIYGVVSFKNIAVGILPVDQDWNTWLVGQYRYTLNRYSWEIPEGGSPIGTDTLASAKRELKEETGIIASDWTFLGDLHTSNSVTDEYGVMYLARELEFGKSEPEETEDLAVRKLPFDSVLDMVLKGEITDGLAMCTILKAAILKSKGAFQ